MDFESWIKTFPEKLDVPSIGFARKVWQAAQAAETERAKGLVEALKACDELMDYMSEYEIGLGLPRQVKDAIAKYEGES